MESKKFVWKIGFNVHKRIIEFVSEKMSCMILRGHWCDITVLKVLAPRVDKIDNVKGSFYA
jgi:hypothetical protein